MYDVIVRGLQFYAHHGVSGDEQAVGHRYLADVRVTVDGAAPTTDRIEDTVDYSSLAALMLSVSSSIRFHTVEALAEHYCSDVLKTMEHVEEVEVTVMKPLPPAPIIAEATGVRIVKKRA